MSQSHNKKDKDNANRNRKQQNQQQQQQNADKNHLMNHKKSNGNGNNSNSTNSKTKTPSPKPSSNPTALPNLFSNANTGSKKKPQNKAQREKERSEREAIVLWRHPLKTVKYCSFEITELMQSSVKNLMQQRILLAGVLVLSIILSFIYYTPGPHQAMLDVIRKNIWFVLYWLGLGIISSVGLGTGLHTFLLYLGPHIASVTLAAYECNSLNFPSPPYPDEITCPDEPYEKQVPNLWSIMSKVRLEAFLWGAGTALGELPPYFMAKASRLSGYDPTDMEEMAEFEELKAKRNSKNLSLMDKGKLMMERIVERVGFFGILACASIPNPLFDLAGITCGHFLVSFWTFFGATLIGKAIIKMHLQKIFVIIAFNETLIEKAVDILGNLPVIGKKLQEPFKGFLKNQKMRLHRQKNVPVAESGNLLSKVFETFVICMVCYFVVSIVNSLAQSYHKRIHKKSTCKAAAPILGGVVKKSSKKMLRE